MEYSNAIEEIKANRYEFDDISDEEIEQAIENYIEELKDQINADPMGFFANNYRFWNSLDKKCK